MQYICLMLLTPPCLLFCVPCIQSPRVELRQITPASFVSNDTYWHSMNYTGALMNWMPANSYNGVAKVRLL